MIAESLRTQQEPTLDSTLADRLLDSFGRAGVIYSHWKSNMDLAQAAAGETDLDLLVDRRSLAQALAILSQLGFKAAVARWGANPPSIRHYYGLDPDIRELVHVHLFSRVLTGESYVKSHVFPFEAMLLDNAHYAGQMRTTSKPAELVLFTLRMFIKYGSLPDLLSLRKKSESLKAELHWLQDGGDLSGALSLLREHCPVMDEHLFHRCVETLDSDRPLISRMVLAGQVRRQLKVYSKYTTFGRPLAYGQLLWAELRRRMGRVRRNKVLQAGGAVVAIVGADATGKSTLVTETERWLGDTFTVRAVHAGKPPSSWLTAPINLALVLLRKLMPSRQSVQARKQTFEDEPDPSEHRFRGLSSLPYALRAVALAWDRRQLTARARRLAAEGEIVICDRYPSRTTGAMDSPRLEAEQTKAGPAAAFYNRLVQLETRLYEQIPPPDVVLKLTVSLETALKRNNGRDKREEGAYLEARHHQSQDWQIPGAGSVYVIDAEQSIESTVWEAKQALWESL
jgi:thymidylate kinase